MSTVLDFELVTSEDYQLNGHWVTVLPVDPWLAAGG